MKLYWRETNEIKYFCHTKWKILSCRIKFINLKLFLKYSLLKSLLVLALQKALCSFSGLTSNQLKFEIIMKSTALCNILIFYRRLQKCTVVMTGIWNDMKTLKPQFIFVESYRGLLQQIIGMLERSNLAQ